MNRHFQRLENRERSHDMMKLSSHLEELKNASEQGLSKRVCDLTFQLLEKFQFSDGRYVRINESDKIKFCTMVSILYLPYEDDSLEEKRFALYYAAQAGHTSLVRTMVALLILSRFLECFDQGLRASLGKSGMTLPKWLDHFNNFTPQKDFGRKHLNMFLRISLNQDVKNILQNEEYTINQFLVIVEKSPWAMHVGKSFSKWKGKKKKCRKPLLNNNDYYDNDYSGGTNSDHSEYHFNSDEVGEDEKEFDDNNVGNDMLDQSPETAEDVNITMELYSIMMDEEEDALKKKYVHQEPESKKEEEEKDEKCDDNDDDDWTTTTSVGFVEVYNDDSMELPPLKCFKIDDDDDDSWSVVSGNPSVRSIKSNDVVFSYSDALRFGKKKQSNNNNNNAFHLIQEEEEEPTKIGSSCEAKKDDVNEGCPFSSIEQLLDHDSVFIRDGVKHSWGGASKYTKKKERKRDKECL